ncbi:MAG TPA: hypothetical protein VMG60_08050 [Burkholderiaceae bacterium]|nr:hypothetical protein [Burkholderiaceae bacterium]
MTRSGLAGATLFLLAGCMSTYTLTLMPRNSGTIYTGEAIERSSTEADLIVAIGSTVYTGTWLYTSAAHSSFWSGFGVGFGSGGSFGTVGVSSGTVDNPYGQEAKALLKAADGSGLRCDFRGMIQGRGGAGECQDDKGLMYDVQIRLKESK